jgi:hypothetical protein
MPFHGVGPFGFLNPFPQEAVMSIDLDFRPASYSDFDGPVALALNGINGQMRRTMVRDMLTVTGEARALYDATLGPVDPDLLEERPEPGRINAVNSLLGPSWLGGEYLPLRKRGEVEIARVVLRSVTMDVFSLRARWGGGRYHYRLVDEYDSDYRLCRKTSKRTLSLRQVIEILETVDRGIETGDLGVVACWWNQQWGHGYSPEDCTAFAWVESEQYPGLPAWYEERAEAWRQEVAASTAEGPA